MPLDLDIFLRSGSKIQPDSAASDHGRTPSSWSERRTVENSQVRMMSWPCGRRSNGKTFLYFSGSEIQPPASCGVREEVAQVSIMSTSPIKPLGLPRWSSVKPVGAWLDGSTGSKDRSGVITFSKSGLPSASSWYQTGIGTPKKRCLETSQSPVRPFTQFSYLTRMKSGWNFSVFPRPISFSRRSSSRPPFRMYHWRVETISSGLSPFSKNLTG